MFNIILKQLRQDLNLSQQELANRLDISQSAIAKWELNKTEPNASALIIISKFFNVSTDFLLGIEDENGNKYTIKNSFNNNKINLNINNKNK